MPTKKLTVVALPHLTEGEWYDVVVPGLILWVGKRRRTWYFRYRSGGSYQRKPLGHFPVMELGEARDAARAVIDRAERGLPAEVPAPHPRSPDVLTLGALLDRYEQMRLREGNRIKTLLKVMRMLRYHLKPQLALPVVQFSKADLRAIRNELLATARPAAANRRWRVSGPVLRWASEEDLVETNIVPSIRRTPMRARERNLTPAEIRANLASLRRSRQHRGRKELRPVGEIFAGRRTAP